MTAFNPADDPFHLLNSAPNPTEFGTPLGGYGIEQQADGSYAYIAIPGFNGGTNIPIAAARPGTPADALAAFAGKYPGPTFAQMLIGIGTLTAITLLTPPKYALFVPIAVLLGYSALHPATITAFFNSISAGVQGITSTAARLP